MSKIWLLLFLLMMPLMSDIDDLIESMQSVSDEERFELMNQFKEEVIQLQEEERMEAMMKVISITDSSHAHEVLEEAQSENIEAHHEAEGVEVETEEAKGSEVDDVNDNIDHAIETSDIAGVQENVSSAIESSGVSNEVDEIETGEVQEND